MERTSLSGMRKYKITGQEKYHNNNCCRQYTPMVAKISGRKLGGETVYHHSFKLSPLRLCINYKKKKSNFTVENTAELTFKQSRLKYYH